MPRSLLLASSLLLAGCLASRTSELVVSDELDAAAVRAPTAIELQPIAPESLAASAEAGSGMEPVAPLAGSTRAEGESLHGSRFTLKGGYYGSDEDGLDDGYIFNVSWMTFLSSLFALELELGYFDADGSEAGADAEVWGAPIMLNGRVNVPIWVLDLYAGLGVGGFYYDAEVTGALSASDDGFLWGGNAFAGATINLAEAIALGLEAKYYLTEDISEFDSSLDAFALMLTVGFSR